MTRYHLSKTQHLDDVDEFFLFAYTDGLTETFNEKDEDFGFDRLLEILKQDCPADLSDLHDQVLKSLNDFKGDRSFHDDITMLSCMIQNK